MTNLQKQTELLEARANEAELLGQLACEPETRAYNRRSLMSFATRPKGHFARHASKWLRPRCNARLSRLSRRLL